MTIDREPFGLPFNILQEKGPWPRCWYIMWGPNKRIWNLLCFPLVSWDLSHFRTCKSPTWKFLSPTKWVSNHFLTKTWWAWNLCLDLFCYSSNLRSVSILCCIIGFSLSCTIWASCREGRNILGGSIASWP